MAETAAQTVASSDTAGAASSPGIIGTEFVDQKLDALHTLLEKVIGFSVQYGFQIIGALIILIIGYLIARWTQRLVVGMLEKRNTDITTRTFIGKTVKLFVLFIAFIVALGNFGVSISPMIAALGALTFGVTIALQGPISNYGAGLTLILSHPFRVGNTVEIQGVSGVVEEIKLACTI
ncbi:MAG: mechanosensitive ion channel, partial [Planctomycetes bacterium]|nr:mechanosensitive ion channel [Planctomycetota bacterium]